MGDEIMGNELNRIKKEIDKLRTQVAKLIEKGSGRFLVPKEIHLKDNDADYHSIGIINDKGQELYYSKTHSAYQVCFGHDDNTGSNYELVEVDKPEVGKLYFSTNMDNMASANDLAYYHIFLDEDYYCWWDISGEHYLVTVGNLGWRQYYEVRKVE